MPSDPNTPSDPNMPPDPSTPDETTLADLRDHLLPVVAELGRWAQERSDDHYLGRGGVEVGFKTSPGDVVTSADLEVQARLSAALKAITPGYGFLGEEADLDDYDPDLPVWVIDPIDGTHNFVRNYPGFCVVVALVHRGESLLAVIFDAATRLLYSAYRGGGAWRHASGSDGLTHERLSIGAPRDLSEAMVTTGFTQWAANDPATLATFAKLAGGSAGLRVSGSAARDVGFVAAGKVDLYWQAGIKPWDVAAGMVLVTEAGGVVELRHSGSDWLRAQQVDIYAGQRDLVAAALALRSS